MNPASTCSPAFEQSRCQRRPRPCCLPLGGHLGRRVPNRAAPSLHQHGAQPAWHPSAALLHLSGQQPSSTSRFQPSPSTGPPSRLYASLRTADLRSAPMTGSRCDIALRAPQRLAPRAHPLAVFETHRLERPTRSRARVTQPDLNQCFPGRRPDASCQSGTGRLVSAWELLISGRMAERHGNGLLPRRSALASDENRDPGGGSLLMARRPRSRCPALMSTANRGRPAPSRMPPNRSEPAPSLSVR